MRPAASCIQITDDPATGAMQAQDKGAGGLLYRNPAGGRTAEDLDALRRIRRDHPDWWIAVNERLDLALALPADALHVGFRGPPLRDLRRLWRGSVGLSVHSVAEAASAGTGVDYLIFGPVRETPSKKGRLEPRGLDGLAAACRAATCPVIGVGGMAPEDVAGMQALGAHGVAFIRGGSGP